MRREESVTRFAGAVCWLNRIAMRVLKLFPEWSIQWTGWKAAVDPAIREWSLFVGKSGCRNKDDLFRASGRLAARLLWPPGTIGELLISFW